MDVLAKESKCSSIRECADQERNTRSCWLCLTLDAMDGISVFYADSALIEKSGRRLSTVWSVEGVTPKTRI